MDNKGFQIDNRFKKSMTAKFERYRLQAGVLKNGPHKEPKDVKQAKFENRKIEAFGPKAPPKFGPPKPKKPKKPKSTLKKISQKYKKKISKAFESKKSKTKRRLKAKVKAYKAMGLGYMEGGPVRLQKSTTKGSLQDIAGYVRKRHNIPYLTAPFKNMKSKEMRLLTKELFNLISNRRKGYAKVEAALRDVIRIPFLKKRYGNNSRRAARIKTFNRLGIDTGQFYQALDGKVRLNPSVQKGSKA